MKVTLNKCGLAWALLDSVCKTICTSIYLGVVSLLATASVRLLGPDPAEGRSVVGSAASRPAGLILQAVEPSSGVLGQGAVLGAASSCLLLFARRLLCQQPVYPLLAH